MQPAYFFGTVVAVTAILVTASLILFKWMSNLIQSQNQILMTLTNLATSKNPETFQKLQWTTTESLGKSQSKSKSQREPVEEAPVLDDASLAKSLAERYQRMGWDPNLAYNQEDPDFVSEFGLDQ